MLLHVLAYGYEFTLALLITRGGPRFVKPPGGRNLTEVQKKSRSLFCLSESSLTICNKGQHRPLYSESLLFLL